jgi:hypothetical protein
LRNYESDANIHAQVGQTEEPIGAGWEEYTLVFTEYWIVGGVLTPNPEAAETLSGIVMNGYYQMSDGYKPNPNSGDPSVRYAITTVTSRAMTDRLITTHKWTQAPSALVGSPLLYTYAVMIPVREADYGQLYIPMSDDYLGFNTAARWRLTLFDAAGTPHQYTSPDFTEYTIGSIGVYPANLNADGSVTHQPADYPNWRYYIIDIMTKAGAKGSNSYLFYNAEQWGQWDCRYDAIRLGWINSRGGFDYFNFIKKSEITDTIERKQYKQTRWRSSSPYYMPSDRVLTDRQTLVTQVLTVTSDWMQENEYVFLRGLLVSNQVHMLLDDGTYLPVSIEDTSFLERRERNGKLYNLQLRVKYSQDYWS